MKLKKWMNENFFYIYKWKKEIKKEKKWENRKEEYLKKWYFKNTNELLNIQNPQTFTEKQQYLKLYDSTKIKTICTDKYLARKFVNNTIGEEYLVPIIKINGKETFKNAFEIKYNQLPDSFVIQCNHGAHMTHIVKNKNKLGKLGFYFLQRKINRELKINYAYCHGYEMQYKDIEPCIFVTKCLVNNNDLPDYKFFCFNGEMKYFSVDTNRFSDHRRTIYDNAFNKFSFQCENYKDIEMNIDKNVILKMLNIVNELASYFDFVRVDLYTCGDKIFFGELTFSSASGIAILSPRESNISMSSYIDLSKIGLSKRNPYEKV